MPRASKGLKGLTDQRDPGGYESGRASCKGPRMLGQGVGRCFGVKVGFLNVLMAEPPGVPVLCEVSGNIDTLNSVLQASTLLGHAIKSPV